MKFIINIFNFIKVILQKIKIRMLLSRLFRVPPNKVIELARSPQKLDSALKNLNIRYKKLLFDNGILQNENALLKSQVEKLKKQNEELRKQLEEQKGPTDGIIGDEPRPHRPPRPIPKDLPEFRRLSSSWIRNGKFWEVNFKQASGDLLIELKRGNKYLYPFVSFRCWEAMKNAKGKNGSGAGSAFWKYHLHWYIKSGLQSTIRKISQLTGTISRMTSRNVTKIAKLTNLKIPKRR